MPGFDPARSRAVLLGTPYYRAPGLADVPEVTRNVADLAALLADPHLAGLPAGNCTVVREGSGLADVGRQLTATAAAAEDLLLIYYAGHGLLGARRHELYLCLEGTDPDLLAFTGLSFDAIRDVCLDSPAAKRVIILDSCYSGRAIGSPLSDAAGEVISQVNVEGTYTMTAAPANRVAKGVLPGEEHTAFTGRLLRLLRDGLPSGNELLSLGEIYHQLKNRLAAEGLPVPEQRGTGSCERLGLIRNAGYRAGAAPVTGRSWADLQREAVVLGDAGSPAVAVQSLRELLTEQQLRGADAADRLDTRHLLGIWTGRAGDRPGAVDLLQQVYAEQRQLLGGDHPRTLRTLAYLGHNLAQSGQYERGIDLLDQAWKRQQALLGHTDADALRTGYLRAVNETDDAGSAESLRDLIGWQTALLGPAHRHTVDSRHGFVLAQVRLGKHDEAARLLAELIPDAERAYGTDNETTLTFRQQLTGQLVESGDKTSAERLLGDLVKDAARALGAAHPRTFDIRYDHAVRAATQAEVAERLDRLAIDQVRLVGASDPSTLTTRRMQVAMVADSTDHEEAYRLAGDLAADHARVLGAEHGDTLLMRGMFGEKAIDSGRLDEGARILESVIANRLRLRGPDDAEAHRFRALLRRHGR